MTGVAFVLVANGATPKGNVYVRRDKEDALIVFLAELQEHMRGLGIPHRVTQLDPNCIGVQVDKLFRANAETLGRVVAICPWSYKDRTVRGLDNGYPTALWVFDERREPDSTGSDYRYFGNIAEKGVTRILTAMLREKCEPFLPQLRGMTSPR